MLYPTNSQLTIINEGQVLVILTNDFNKFILTTAHAVSLRALHNKLSNILL